MEQRRDPRISTASRSVLAAGRRAAQGARAAIGHALAFDTWRSLVRAQGLSNKQAVELVTRLVG